MTRKKRIEAELKKTKQCISSREQQLEALGNQAFQVNIELEELKKYKKNLKRNLKKGDKKWEL